MGDRSKREYRLKKKINKRSVGSAYEAIAEEYLVSKGYRILEKNFLCRGGEIDLIAQKNGVYVACEIKYRRDYGCGDPFEAVGVRKQRRICATMLYYLVRRGLGEETPCRFDVIGIYGDGEVRHIENAFEFTGI